MRLHLQTLSWSVPVRALGGHNDTLAFAHLLSNEWVTGLLIDSMMMLNVERAKTTPKVAARVHFGRVLFSEQLLITEKFKGLHHSELEEHVNALQKGSQHIFYFPVNIQKAHWILFQVDFVNKSFLYGALSQTFDETLCSCYIIIGDSLPQYYPLLAHICKAFQA